MPPPHTQTNDRIDWESLYLAFNKKYPIVELKEMRPLVGDHLQYKPWVQIGNYDHVNKYSIVTNGIRKSKNADCQENLIDIWFLGGSTTYGIGVPFWDSIPSYFSDIAKKTNNNCVRVTNFGTPLFYSAQELVLFSNLLIKHTNKPKIVIFLDGLNDFAQPESSMNLVPYFSYNLENLIPKGNGANFSSINTNKNFFEKFLSYKIYLSFFKPSSSMKNVSINQYKENFNSTSNEEVVRITTRNFRKAQEQLEIICSGYKIRCFQFLQPVPIKDYSSKATENLTADFRTSNSHDWPRQRIILLNAYKDISKNVNNSKYFNFQDISSIFVEYDGIPYVDNAHYSPGGNNLIAQRIYENVFKEK